MMTMSDCEASESQVMRIHETISKQTTKPSNSTLHKTEEMLNKASINYTNATLTSRDFNISFLAQV